MRRALDYLSRYADATNEWEKEQITPIAPARMLELLRVGQLVYGDTAYGALIARMPQDAVRTDRAQLLYP